MQLTENQRTFLEKNHNAAMITIGQNGIPKAVRVAVVLVDGNLWSSGTQDRTRTARLRRDPRCTVFVFDASWQWLTLETTVRILDGPDTAQLHVRLARAMQNRPTGNLSWFGKELNEGDFVRTMEQERRLIYEFEIQHAYGIK